MYNMEFLKKECVSIWVYSQRKMSERTGSGKCHFSSIIASDSFVLFCKF